MGVRVVFAVETDDEGVLGSRGDGCGRESIVKRWYIINERCGVLNPLSFSNTMQKSECV